MRDLKSEVDSERKEVYVSPAIEAMWLQKGGAAKQLIFPLLP